MVLLKIQLKKHRRSDATVYKLPRGGAGELEPGPEKRAAIIAVSANDCATISV
jgi:hypothetical protein